MAERFVEVDRIFRAALRIEAGDRRRFVEAQCASDESLLKEVLALLAEDATLAGKGPLDRPALAGGVELNQFTPHAEPAPAHVPGVIGRYRIVRRIGEGGMGVVYEAKQESPNRTVALKVIHAGVASADMLRRFEHEAQVLGRLQHPCIAQIFEAGTFDSGHGAQPYFAMEYIEGEPLTAYVSRQNPSTRQRLALLARICEAVQHAHQRGVIHRDLKPGNILVIRSAASGGDHEVQPKILDFGVARATDADVQSATLQTDIGQLIGTIPYMSPEQAAGDPRDLDTRSDVYAIGVLAYEVLAGRLPYDVRGKLVHEAVRIIREEEPTELSTVNRVLAGDVQTIISKALEKDKTRRYQSASALADDIHRYLNDEPIAARRPSAAYQLRKFAQRNKTLVGAAAAIALAVIAAAIISIRFGISEAAANRLAVKAGNESEQRRIIAERETAIAKAVNEFLNHDLLEAVDPEIGDRSITVRDALDRATQRIGERFRDQPMVEAAIRTTLATTYRNLGDHEAAASQAEEALRLRQAHALDSDSVEVSVIDAEHLLATIYSDQGRLDDAQRLFEHALETGRIARGTDHPLTIATLNDLALLLKRQGRYQQAKAMFIDALALQQNGGGESHIDTLAIMTNIADVCSNLEEFDEAEPLFREVLTKRTQEYGPLHPRTLSTLDGLAQMLERLGDRDQARMLYQQVIDGRTEALGPEHPDTLDAVVRAASLDAAMVGSAASADAEATLRRVLEVRTRILGEDDPDTLTTMHDLGGMVAARNLNEADSLLSAALEGRRRILGDMHPATLISMNNLAMVRTNLGSVDEAIVLYEEALPGLKAVYGAEHSNTLATAQNLANLYGRVGRSSDAEPLWIEVIALRREAVNPDALLPVAMNNLAYLYTKMDRDGDAEPLMLEALEMQRRSKGDRNPETFSMMNNLASLYARQERYDDSAALFAELVPLVRETLGSQHGALAATILQWGDVLIAANRADEAERAIQEAGDIYRATKSASGWQIAHSEVMMGASIAAQNRFEEAERFLLTGYESLRAAADVPPRHVQNAVERIIELYESWPKPDKADQWRGVLASSATQGRSAP